MAAENISITERRIHQKEHLEAMKNLHQLQQVTNKQVRQHKVEVKEELRKIQRHKKL